MVSWVITRLIRWRTLFWKLSKPHWVVEGTRAWASRNQQCDPKWAVCPFWASACSSVNWGSWKLWLGRVVLRRWMTWNDFVNYQLFCQQALVFNDGGEGKNKELWTLVIGFIMRQNFDSLLPPTPSLWCERFLLWMGKIYFSPQICYKTGLRKKKYHETM